MPNPYYDPTYNPYSQSVLIGTGILFLLLPIFSVGLRFYARFKSWAQLGIDDWIAVASMFICIALSITQIIATTKGGLGGHQELINGQAAHTTQLYVYEKTKYAYQLLGTIGLWVIKLSVLLFYRRIFSISAFRTANNVFLGLTVAWGIAFTLVVAFQCLPVSNIWNKFEIEYGNSCIQVQPFYLALAISDVLLDVSICIMPIQHVRRLQMPLRQRIAVASIFLLGSIVVAIGITRAIIFGWVISFTTNEPLVYFSDITWYTAGTLFWHLAENEVGLLGCCLPTYAPLFKSLLQKRKTSGVSPGSAGWKLNKRTHHSSYHQHPQDETALTGRALSDQASVGTFEGHVLELIPNNRIRINKEFHVEASMV
ncbi:hypothetical protein F5X99DRAFT_375153 [Biscogniauxia marginata]|nr:hypothetical protein F5X99DRAFT_375153 [Biscogniauxia marginata]